jgi:hypothetical protein
MFFYDNILSCAGHLPANGLRMRTAGITDRVSSLYGVVVGVESEWLEREGA